MQHCDTLILASWCIPVEPHELVLANYAVAINDGQIVELLPAADARNRYSAGAIIERPDHVLIPGFVNAHTHGAMTLFRGLADDLPLERWLKEIIWPAENRFVGPEMVRDGTRLAIAEMLLGGCTCFSDQYFFPEIIAQTAVDSHMRAMVGTPVLEFATPWAGNATEYLNKGADLVHDRYADHSLVSTCFAPHSTAAVSDKSFGDLRVMADQLDKRIQIHLHESAKEIEDAVAATGMRPIDRLEALGLVNASLTAVHAVHLTDDEINRFVDAGVSVVHCPRSNLKLADGIARVTAMRDAGLIVGLGTDGAASNNVLDMLGEMRIAALLAKAQAGDASVLSAANALRMATLEGARTIGLDDQIGSIEVGKSADLVCIDLMYLNSQPVYDPVSQLVYTVQPQQIKDVWVAGRHQVEAGALVQIDQAEILERTSEWRQKINSQIKPGRPNRENR
ncbi:MAG: TRZ/ATZ family hydrolase [Proteobacteria bacterium]|nr:TRZ/ATZ family hydrolase [Pseudomonadota bacterium]MDA0994683.1 TRZ/ATZ family hydrolase [Pseudomonadota bacterium]